MSNEEKKDTVAEQALVSEYTDGGHEIDRPPAATLFGFLAVTGIIIVVTAIGVFQLFSSQTDEEAAKLAADPTDQRVVQAERDAIFRTTYGVISDEDGTVTGYRMPIDTAKTLVLEHPDRFAPAPPPAGWVHPDDAGTPPPPAPEKE